MMLDIHGIIDFCCGEKNPDDVSYKLKQEILAKLFDKCGFEKVQPLSIQKWIERGQIPGDRLVQLHVIAQKHNKKLDLNTFLKSSSPKKARRIFG